VKKFKTRVQGFCKSLTFKKKQLVIATLLIFLNCLSWKKVHASPFLDNSKINVEIDILKNSKKQVQGVKKCNIDSWGVSNNNFFSVSETFHKHSSDFSFQTNSWGLKKKNNQSFNAPFFFPELIEKINEAEKLRKKTNKLNFGEMIISGLKIFDTKYSFFSELVVKPNFSGPLESLELATFTNPDLQSFSSCLNLFPEVKFFHSLEKLIPEDPGKGFVLGKISSDSGSDFSKEIIINQKTFGYHTIRNLKDAFKYQKKVSSLILRKDSDCVSRNKSDEFGKWVLSSEPKNSKITLLDLSTEKIKISKTKRNKILMFFSNNSENLRNFSPESQREEIFEENMKNFSSQESFLIKKLKSFNNLDLTEDVGSKISNHRPKLHGKSKFGKIENKTITVTPSFENHIGFCKEFFLSKSEINLRWNVKNRIFPFHLHSLRKNIKKFILPVKLKISKPIEINFLNGDNSFIFVYKNLSKKNFKKTQRNFFDEILKSKQSLSWEEEKKEDSDVSHLKESLKLNDHLGIEFLGKIYSMGLNFPRSHIESTKFFSKSSALGNLDAQYALGASFFEGKGAGKDKKISRKLIASAAKLGHMDSIYDLSVLEEKGLGGKIDIIRAFHLNKQIVEFGGDEKIISKKITKKEKVGLSQVFFSSLKNPNETNIQRCFIGSLFFSSMSFFSGVILEKGNKIASSLSYQNKTISENCFNSILSIIELFLENRQTFLSIEKCKLSNGFYSKLENTKSSSSLFSFSKPIDTIVKLRSVSEIYFKQSKFFLFIFRALPHSLVLIKIVLLKLNRFIIETITGKKINKKNLGYLIKFYFASRIINFLASFN